MPLLDRIGTFFSGPDPDRLFERNDKDLAITDTSGFCGVLDCLNHLVDLIITDCDRNL
jgi:hypothetical protein